MKEGLKSSLLNKVKVTDKFWRGYQELVMDTVIPYQEKILNDEIPGVEKSHALANFRIAAGLEEPDDGSVVRRRNLYIRYLPQIPAFTAGDTVLDAIVRDNRDEPHFSSREEIEASAKNILTRLGIYDFDEKVEHLSGGQRKRVAFHGRSSDPGRADKPPGQ